MEPLDPAEKLLADIQYWEEQERGAQKTIRYAKAILPGLRDSLKALRREGFTAKAEGRKGAKTKGSPAPAPLARPATSQAHPAGAGEEPRFRGRAEEQVEQALRAKAPQSPLDLVDFIGARGKTFSRGAIDLGLRKLREAGKVKEAKKEGNIHYYELTAKL